MNATHTINFEITDVRGRKHALRVLNVESGEWLLQTSIDGRLFTYRCRAWQAVERTIRSLRARSADRSLAAASSEPGSARALVASVLLFVSILATSAGLAQQRPPDDADGIARFVRAAEDYALLHRRLEQAVPSIQVNANPEAFAAPSMRWRRSFVPSVATQSRAICSIRPHRPLSGRESTRRSGCTGSPRRTSWQPSALRVSTPVRSICR